METNTFYAYSWYIDNDEKNITSKRIYGLGKKNENICIRIDNFTPFVYVELPTDIEWSVGKVQLLTNKLDSLLQDKKPITKSLTYKKRLYYSNLDKDGNRKQFPYLFLTFSNKQDINSLSYIIKKILPVVGVGNLKLKLHEQDADSFLQFTCLRNIPTAGWIKFRGKLIDEYDKITRCDYEYIVQWKNVYPDNSLNEIAIPYIMSFDIEVNSTNPTAMPNAKKPGDKVFQISCILAKNGEGESKYEKYILSLGNPDQKTTGNDVNILCFNSETNLLIGFVGFIQKYKPNLIIGYNILGFDIPYMIARAKLNFCIQQFDLIGFTKYKHAKETIIKWNSSAFKNQQFEFLDAEGILFVDLLPLIRRDFKFSNYKLSTVATHFLKQGKDPLSVKGIFKCYRIGMKDYQKDSEKGSKALGLVARYCIVDSVIVLKLFNVLNTWIGLAEMAKTCNVNMFCLYTQGQQIKVYSQVYKSCMYAGYVVEKDGYIPDEDEHYRGATVFDPITGVHDGVVPFDFCSLYPTTMIAYNICWSTLVNDDNIPDKKCHVMEWEDHLACSHDPNVIRKMELTKYIDGVKNEVKKIREKKNKTLDKYNKIKYTTEIDKILLELKPYIKERSECAKKKPKHKMCAKRRYRFLKEPKGILPTIIQNLLDARKNTRNQIKILKSLSKNGNTIDTQSKDVIKDIFPQINTIESNQQLSDTQNSIIISLNEVLEQRQLAYKVSANSMYGALGVTRGYLPFMPGAMATTYMGRKAVELAAKVIPEKYGGKLIYGDTDSILPDTPVLIFNNGNLEYMTVEELSNGNWNHTITGKEISKPKAGLLVWSDKGFTEIKEVIRHAITKPLIRVTTHVGSVDCTLDHSLLWENGEAAKGSDIKVGDRLCISELPLSEDTPTFPIYKNKLTEKIIEHYVIPDCFTYPDNMTAEMCFVWGMFYAEGSCGSYKGEKSSLQHRWAISGQDNKLLTRCADILNKNEKNVQFKILDTMKSSNANKLVPVCKIKGTGGHIKELVQRYRELFYDCRRSKRVPSLILNLPFDYRQAFFMGYYAGDGSKKDPSISLSNKGAIGSAGLFYIMRSIGYQVSINTRADKPTIYKLTGSSSEMKMRYSSNVVKKIHPTAIYNKNTPLIKSNEIEKPEYIYDIETENHHFAAGVGQLIVHNSNYVVFPEKKTSEEIWDWSEHVSREVSKMFPPPMKLEFESVIYWRFLILTKKRYMSLSCQRDGVLSDKISKKGVLLARRDNSETIRDIYSEVTMGIFNKTDRNDILYNIVQHINKICGSVFNINNFIMTKAVGDQGDLTCIESFIDTKDGKRKGKTGDYTVPLLSNDVEKRKQQFKLKNCNTVEEYYTRCLPAQVQLAEKMRIRGKRVDPGSRLEYVITIGDGHSDKQYMKIEDVEYYKNHADILKIDYIYYLKLLCNPLDQLLDCCYYKQDDNSKYKFKAEFVKEQYKFRLLKTKTQEQLKNLFIPKIIFL